MDTETRAWGLGEVLVFDDSFEHEVWWRVAQHPSRGGEAKGGEAPGGSTPDTDADTRPRVVLIVDVFHPDLTAKQKAIYWDAMLASDS